MYMCTPKMSHSPVCPHAIEELYKCHAEIQQQEKEDIP